VAGYWRAMPGDGQVFVMKSCFRNAAARRRQRAAADLAKWLLIPLCA
jgi:hypothetical protein